MAQKSSSRQNRILIAAAVLLVIVALTLLAAAVFNSKPASIPTATPSAMPTGTPTPTSPPITPLEPGYLPYLYPNGNASSVYLLSATYSYGTYPFPTVNETGIAPVKTGTPCFIINVTVRNDYTVQNPPPGADIEANVTGTPISAQLSVGLTAQIFGPQGQITAMDITPPYPPIGYSGANIYGLASGENDTATIYLATNSTNVSHFALVVEYISAMPPP